jgi:hypothetical protein
LEKAMTRAMTRAGTKLISAAVEAVEALKRTKASDQRPQRLGWAPGGYMSICCRCEEHFIGDKRAVNCADCAYAA